MLLGPKLLGLAILGATLVHASLYDNDGFEVLERTLQGKYPHGIKDMYLEDLLPLLHDLSLESYSIPVAAKLFKTVASAVRDYDCGNHAHTAARSLHERFGFFNHRAMLRVVSLSRKLFNMMADTCGARRIPVARLVLKDTNKLVRERVRNLGSHLLAVFENQTDGGTDSSTEYEAVKAIATRSVSSAHILAVFEAVRERALAEKDPAAEFLAHVNSLNPPTKDELVDKLWRDEARREMRTAYPALSNKKKAIALFNRYVYEPCEIYLSDMAYVLEPAWWEVKRHKISEHYTKNEDFYEALVDYDFCKFVRDDALFDLFANLIKKNIQ